MTRQDLRVVFQDWWCGCGAADEAYALVADVLAVCPLHSNREAFERLIPHEGMQMFVLYILTKMDLIEHGGSVGGSWLTDTGKAVLEALEREREDHFDALSDSCCLHGYSVESELHDCPECSKLNAARTTMTGGR